MSCMLVYQYDYTKSSIYNVDQLEIINVYSYKIILYLHAFTGHMCLYVYMSVYVSVTSMHTQ